jgi:hypothetical protein
MLQVYVNPFYSTCAQSIKHHIFHSIDQLPEKCDLIAVAYFHRNVSAISAELELLITKTNNLLVHLEEFNDSELFNIVNDPRWQNCKFFYNMVPTDSLLNQQTVITWTCSGYNIYSDRWNQESITKLDRDVNPDKKYFDCLLGRQRTHRDFIEQCYRQSSIQNQIIFSYYKQDLHMSQGIWDKNFLKYPYAPQMVLPVDIYNQSYYSIVAETDARYSFFSFFTEKTAKPIVAQRLFVMFAAKNYLKNLRKLGFQTFDGIIDESYDQIDDDTERWARAWQQVEFLCSCEAQLVLKEIQPILQHNFDHFMNTDWWAGMKQEFEKMNKLNK